MVRRLARFKVYIDRARWYYVLSQFFMIIIIFLRTIGIRPQWWEYLAIVIATLFIMIFLGYADRRFGMIREEQRLYSTENPVMQDIIRRLNNIENPLR